MPAHILLRIAIFLPFLLLGSCLRVPLGDPEKSQVEQQFVGEWLWEDTDSRNLILVRPWDARTYVVIMHTLSQRPGEAKVGTGVMKGWLTAVKGQTFVTLQEAEALGRVPAGGEAPIYFVMKIELVDQQLIATGLSSSFPPFEAPVSPQELERLIGEHIDNPAMWAEKPATARRATEVEAQAFTAEMERQLPRNLE